jgi:hypothetical protein
MTSSFEMLERDFHTQFEPNRRTEGAYEGAGGQRSCDRPGVWEGMRRLPFVPPPSRASAFGAARSSPLNTPASSPTMARNSSPARSSSRPRIPRHASVALTVEVGFELLLRVLGQPDGDRAVVDGTIERLHVVANDLVERRPLGAMAEDEPGRCPLLSLLSSAVLAGSPCSARAR